MSDTSQNATYNGTQQPKGQHTYSSGDIRSSCAQGVHEFMRTTDEGGDPITALPFRAASSQQQTIAAHQARAQRNIDESMAKFSGQKK
ncbi:hypothetical protein DL770_000742 [Monosporascus sp. CRB-9-2]|nr:hypothetical protein DL770_000742 [Monosporascus sp. CRB-9-2]